MALQVWLPLTRDLKNQGLSSVTVSGGVIDNNGKLGKCYLVSKTNPLIIAQTLSTTSEWSLAFWMKLPASMNNATAWESMIKVPSINADTGVESFSIIDWTSYHNIKIWDDSNHQWKWAAPGTDFNYDQWHHWTIAHTANGAGVQCKIYIDGNLIGTYNNTTHPMKICSGNIIIGGDISTGGFYLNDFRIYNHCLSPMEVKQIAQGLVLHYPLNRNGWGQENLIRNTDFEGVPQKYTVTSGTEGGFIYTPTEALIADTEYIVSCRLRGNANMNLYKLCTGGNESLSWVNRNQLSTTEYRPFSIVFTYPSSKTLNQIYICTRYGTASTSIGDWFEIEPNSLKLEKGSKATPWCPNSADALATTLGLNGTTEYDCSGFGNNGERIGTFTWTSDTPKYNTSTHFDTTSYLNTNFKEYFGTGNFTFSAWVKMPLESNLTYQPVFTCKGAEAASAGVGLYYNHNQNKFLWSTANGNNAVEIWTVNSVTNFYNNWTHIVMVRDDNDAKKGCIYVNGIRQELTSIPSVVDVTNTNTAIMIGGMPTAYTAYKFTGEMSDFRIYATALSAADVKSLYQNSAYIDSSGNVYGAVHSEV